MSTNSNNSLSDKAKQVFIKVAAGAIFCFCAGALGLVSLIGISINVIASLLRLPENIKLLFNEKSKAIDVVTTDQQGIVSLLSTLGCIALMYFPSAPNVPLTLAVLVPLLLVGLGSMALRGIEHSASSSNEFTDKHKFIGNASACGLAVLISQYFHLEANTLLFAVFAGMLLSLVPACLSNVPRLLTIVIPTAAMVAWSYSSYGALAALTVAMSVLINADAIGSGLRELRKGPNTRHSREDAACQYTFSYPLLQTVIAAVAIQGLMSLAHLFIH